MIERWHVHYNTVRLHSSLGTGRRHPKPSCSSSTTLSPRLHMRSRLAYQVNWYKRSGKPPPAGSPWPPPLFRPAVFYAWPRLAPAIA